VLAYGLLFYDCPFDNIVSQVNLGAEAAKVDRKTFDPKRAEFQLAKAAKCLSEPKRAKKYQI